MLLKNFCMPKIPFWVFILLALLYFTAVRVDTMDTDASQYAEMSREMMHSNNYLQLYDRGHDYLDKPPVLFWVNAASMKVFGVNNFGYKFPSILFALLALYAVYRLTKLLYNEETGRMAALILGSCQGMFLMTNDVRCDTILLSWVVTAIWLIKEWEVSNKLHYLLLGAGCIAFGMMTKGPIALMVPAFCFVSDWVLKRKWNYFFKPQYLLALLVIAVLLIPMSIGLYQQFDLHPEKAVNGATHVSGLRFFFWEQSFGRITGENAWSNGAGFDFLLSNMLWSFLPWIFLFMAALVINIVQLAKQGFRLRPNQEWISTGGFILSYCALGLSHYQLPHYIFVAFPLAAIMVAGLMKDFFEGRYTTLYKVMKPAQLFVIIILFIGTTLTFSFVFPATNKVFIAWGICLVIWLYIAFAKRITGKLFWLSASAIMLCNIFITNFFYYHLLEYEVGAKMGKYLHNHHIAADNVFVYRLEDPIDALPFYAHGFIKSSDTMLLSFPTVKYVLAGDTGMNELRVREYKFDIVKHGKFFKVSELTPQFLNPATRDSATKNYYLLKMR